MLRIATKLFRYYHPLVILICTTPRKLVMYAPMGAQRAESCTVAQ